MKVAVVEHLYCFSVFICFYCLTAYNESGFYYCTSTPTKQYFCNHAADSLHKILE